HIADNPGRHQPGTGEVNYGNVFEAIAETEYDGFVGCEFTPTGEPEAALETVVGMAGGAR
ncbi:MAG: TIM barrel protein, partial [Halobacteriaceae archaeon]